MPTIPKTATEHNGIEWPPMKLGYEWKPLRVAGGETSRSDQGGLGRGHHDVTDVF